MAVNDELLKQLASLAQGRKVQNGTLQQVAQNDTAPGAPDASTSTGQDVENSILAFLRVEPRLNTAYRQADVTIPVIDAATTYRITITGANDGAVNFDESGHATVAALLLALETRINTTVGSADVTASVDDPTTPTTITLSGQNKDPDFAISVTPTSGTGTMVLEADATAITGKVWAYVRGRDVPSVPPGGESVSVSAPDGYLERFTVAGLQRLYFEPLTWDGRFRWAVDNCILEEEVS